MVNILGSGAIASLSGMFYSDTVGESSPRQPSETDVVFPTGGVYKAEIKHWLCIALLRPLPCHSYLHSFHKVCNCV